MKLIAVKVRHPGDFFFVDKTMEDLRILIVKQELIVTFTLYDSKMEYKWNIWMVCKNNKIKFAIYDLYMEYLDYGLDYCGSMS